MLNYFPGEEKLIPISTELKLRTNLDRIFGVACYQIRLFLTTVNLLVIPIHSMVQSAWGIKAIRLGDGINTSADTTQRAENPASEVGSDQGKIVVR